MYNKEAKTNCKYCNREMIYFEDGPYKTDTCMECYRTIIKAQQYITEGKNVRLINIETEDGGKKLGIINVDRIEELGGKLNEPERIQKVSR